MMYYLSRCSLGLALALCMSSVVRAAGEDSAPTPASQCLASGDGYLRARLSGAIAAELDWKNDGTECIGAIRPTDGGIRMRFSRTGTAEPGTIALVFGISKL